MTDKLSIYNGALNAMREPPLSSLTENRPARKTLDVFYEQAVKSCLGKGKWTFASRFLKLDADVSVFPAFGYNNFFQKPSDYINFVGVWSDGYMLNPLGQYYDNDKDGFYANNDSIYLKYVSCDTGFGLDLNKWTMEFLDYVQRCLAFLTAGTITQSRVTQADLKQELKESLAEALNTNAREKPALRMPEGTWVSSRHGRMRRGMYNYTRTGNY